MPSTVYTEWRKCFRRKAALQYLTLVNKHCGNFDHERLWFFHSHVMTIVLLCHCFTNTTPHMILQYNQPTRHILSEMKERQHGSVNTRACERAVCFMCNGYFWGPRSAALAVSRGLRMLEELEAKLLSPRIATCVWEEGWGRWIAQSWKEIFLHSWKLLCPTSIWTWGNLEVQGEIPGGFARN